MIVTYPPGADELRSRLAYHLALTGTIVTPAWRDAFAEVPRHLFAPTFDRRLPGGETQRFDSADPAQRAEWLDAVYSDDSLVTQRDAGGTATSSTSQPTLMAIMLEALDARTGDRVLEIGTGTGYNAALLCHRLGDGKVTSVDVDGELVDQARDRLAALHYRPTLITADGMAGWAQGAPYDRIIATCSVPRVPAAWVTQTRPGGMIVVNIGHVLVSLRVASDGSVTGRAAPTGAAFMPARPAGTGRCITAEDAYDLTCTTAGDTKSTTVFEVVFDAEFAAVVSVASPGLRAVWSDGWYVVVDPDTASWARADHGDAGTIVTQAGPRHLWDEIEAVHAWWEMAMRPAHDQLGLTVTPDGRHTLWVDDPGEYELVLNYCRRQ